MNFKSIASAELAPARLTVIAGANSSGKSSLLQALLFLAQSFGEPTSVINGDLVRLGEPTDVIRDGTHDITLEFGFPAAHRAADGEMVPDGSRMLRLTLDEPVSTKRLTVGELSYWRDGERELLALRDNPPADLELADQEVALRVHRPENVSLPPDTFLTIAGVTPSRLVYRADPAALEKSFELMLQEITRGPSYIFDELIRAAGIAEPRGRQIRLDLRHGQATGDPLTSDERAELLVAFSALEAPDGWVSEPIASSSVYSFWRPPVVDSRGEVGAPRLAHDLGRAADQVERLATAVLYLGPLRDDPRVAYPLGHTVRALPVGEKGEFTAAYLQENERIFLRFGHPEKGPGTRDSLSNAVSAWSAHLGIAARVGVEPQGKLGHQLGLRVGGRDRDPTAIGVGASQLLPVIVLVLGAPEGAIVLLEQPELHLHPKVQSRLADLFTVARPDIRLVIETHSEYLITRLRLRIAQGHLDPSAVSVLFASQTAEPSDDGTSSPHTSFAHLSVDEMGDFDSWPEDFFDALDDDAVGLARAVASRLRRAKDLPE